MAIFTGKGRDGSDGVAGHPTPSGSGKRGAFSVISADVVVTGNIAASADLHIDGRVDGDVQCATLIQGQDSRIVGAVIAESARLGGAIEGSVAVRQLTIERSARITGDVHYESISIEIGASVDGHLKHVTAAGDAAMFARGTAPTIAMEDVVHFTSTVPAS